MTGRTRCRGVDEDAPGGHGFSRTDSPLARGSRAGLYGFLAKHLGK